jgi:hypothetical protein
MSPPATWNTEKPPIQAINRITNSIVQMLIAAPYRDGQMKAAVEELFASRRGLEGKSPRKVLTLRKDSGFARN